MTNEIVLDEVAARPLAAVRRRILPSEIATAWKPALDQVWAFLRQHDGLRTDGHNIFVYHHAQPGERMAVDFGVEVSGPFDGAGEVASAQTPAGRVVSTLHVGPIERLGEAQQAIRDWCAARGLALGEASWEIYGDWGDDPAAYEVRLFQLLA